MTLAIDCVKASEFITAAVDDRLPAEERKVLDVHLIQCRLCRIEMELERRTKEAVRTGIKSIAAPARLRDAVAQAVHHESNHSEVRSREAGLLKFFTPVRTLAFGGAFAGVAALIWIFAGGSHSHTRPADGNIVTEAFNRYDELIEGKLAPKMQSDDHEAVRSYLSRNVSFPVKMPPMPEFTLIGATLTVTDQETVAHIIYKWDETYVYLEETDARKVAPGRRSRFIPSSALDDLQRSGWHFDGNLSDCTLAMWLADSTLCTAVADMDKQLLLANLTGITR